VPWKRRDPGADRDPRGRRVRRGGQADHFGPDGAVAAVVRGYGLLVRRGVESRGAPESPELHDALDALRTHRGEVTDLLLMDPRGRDVLWGLTAALLTTVDRVLLEIDAGARPA
jgi:hypothetical protein